MIEHEKSVREILEKSKFGLTERDIENANVYLDHREWGVAFDLICTQLYEYDVRISPELRSEIARTARRMGMKDTVWDFLETEE